MSSSSESSDDEPNQSSSSESSDDEPNQKKQATLVAMGFAKDAPVAVDSDTSDCQTSSKESSEPSLSPSANDLKMLECDALDKLILSKGRDIKALDNLISVKERQLKDVQDRCEDYSIKSTGPTRLTPETQTTFLINLHNIGRLHPKDKKSTAVYYIRKYKGRVTEGSRYPNISQFEKYQWGTYEGATVDLDIPPLVKCGLCCLANTNNCEIWHGGKKTNEHQQWIVGFRDWSKINPDKKWLNHEKSDQHLRSIEFLYDHATQNIGADVQSRGKAYLHLCQEKNRNFFARGTFEAVKWLAKRRLALYGDGIGG